MKDILDGLRCYSQQMNTKRMKYVAGTVVLAAMLLGSCSSTSFLGLSKSSYVDEELEKLKQEDEAVDELREELSFTRAEDEQLREEMEALRAAGEDLKTELESLIAAEMILREAIDELNQQAGDISDRLDTVPEETLMELVRAVEAYLDQESKIADGESAAVENGAAAD